MRCTRFVPALVAAVLASGCAGPAATPSNPSATSGGGPAVFYAKDGALYLSRPAGSPARKLTDGPGDTDPAPSPDGTRVAYVHRGNAEEPGGELRVLDVATGDSRRLVDPAALAPRFDEDHPAVTSPRWSPAGDRIAFLKATFGGGGFLLTADADTGAVTAPPKPMFADFDYAWSPDGARLAWAGGRSDVSPVDVSVYTVGATSVVAAAATNATSVGFAADGRSVIFSNADATGSLFAAIPFELRTGGIYSVAPPGRPVSLLAGATPFADVQPLAAGAVGFTAWTADQSTKAVGVLEGGSRREVTETPGDAPAPQWIDAQTVVYVGTAADRPLLIRTGAEEPRRVDSGVESFAAHTGG